MTIYLPWTLITIICTILGVYLAVGLVVGYIRAKQISALCKLESWEFIRVYAACVLMWLPMELGK